MRKAKLLDGYVETKAIAEGDVFADLFSLTGYGISFARDVAYSHSAATRRDPNDYTFQLTLSGCGVFEKDGEAELMTAGRGFLCDIRNDTSYRYYYPEEATEPWAFIYFQFRGTSASEIARRLISESGNVFNVSTELPFFGALPKCRDGHRTVLIPASQSAEIVMSLLRELASSAERDAANANYEQIVQRAFDILDKPGRPPTIGELANLLGVTREHLSRVFARIVGMPANEYLHDRMLTQIVNQLSFSDRPVKDIASSLGFASVNTMLRMFRNRLGRYPTVVRGEMRDGADRKSLRSLRNRERKFS